MPTAYNPGLQVTPLTVFRKERRLPLAGEVLVTLGQQVQSEDIVARTFLPGNVQLLHAAHSLNCMPKDVPGYMLKKEGDPVATGEVIACATSFFGLAKRTITSPLAGTLETVSPITGQMILREKPVPVAVRAFVSGRVVAILPQEGAVIETTAALIQGIFGIGGEVVAPLQIAVADREAILSDNEITPAGRGKILIAGSLVTSQALKKAVQIGVAGIVTGGIHDQDLKDFLGYELGIAITGSEDKGLTLILTEGFGPMPMANKTFQLLQQNQGKPAAIHGATQIRAGVIRPEIVIPQEHATIAVSDKPAAAAALQIGSWVRIIRQPHFGKIAQVRTLPSPLAKMESEVLARVVEVEFADRTSYILPRANVEIFEQ